MSPSRGDSIEFSQTFCPLIGSKGGFPRRIFPPGGGYGIHQNDGSSEIKSSAFFRKSEKYPPL